MRRKWPVSTAAFPIRFASSVGEVMPESIAVFNSSAELSLKRGMFHSLESGYSTMARCLSMAFCNCSGSIRAIGVHAMSAGYRAVPRNTSIAPF
jgi:hypothetical protein